VLPSRAAQLASRSPGVATGTQNPAGPAPPPAPVGRESARMGLDPTPAAGPPPAWERMPPWLAAWYPAPTREFRTAREVRRRLLAQGVTIRFAVYGLPSPRTLGRRWFSVRPRLGPCAAAMTSDPAVDVRRLLQRLGGGPGPAGGLGVVQMATPTGYVFASTDADVTAAHLTQIAKALWGTNASLEL